MSPRKLAAGLIAAAVLPVMVDAAVDPFADRGMVESWWYGAGPLALAVVLGWALGELAAGEGP